MMSHIYDMSYWIHDICTKYPHLINDVYKENYIMDLYKTHEVIPKFKLLHTEWLHLNVDFSK